MFILWGEGGGVGAQGKTIYSSLSRKKLLQKQGFEEDYTPTTRQKELGEALYRLYRISR